MDNNAILAEARHLTKEYPAERGKKVHAVTNVSFEIHEGETLGIVGESGCGKSTLGNMIVNLVQPTSGDIFIRGEKATGLSDRDYMRFRRQIQLIFQDTYASLDPRMTVRDIIAEPLETWHICPDAQATTAKVLEIMEAVGLPSEYLGRYPHQFSGGQRQRIGIARAIAADPALIVCDEPVSALDVSVQNQILNSSSATISLSSAIYRTVWVSCSLEGSASWAIRKRSSMRRCIPIRSSCSTRSPSPIRAEETTMPC